MKIKAYISWYVPYPGATPTISSNTYNAEEFGMNGYSQTQCMDIEIGDFPAFDNGVAVAAQVKTLNAEKAVLLSKVAKIEDQIASLACLEHKPEVV